MNRTRARRGHNLGPGVDGEPDEVQLLSDHGYSRQQDMAGDVCYVSPDDVIHLYADGTWESDKAPEQFEHLPSYLFWRSKKSPKG
ncbi:MAG: hypothetical protein WAM56_21460 [Acidobacteriaceae bacterium]